MNFFQKAGSRANTLYGKVKQNANMLGKLSSTAERAGSIVEKGSRKVGNALNTDTARAVAFGLGGPSGLVALEAGKRIASGAQSIGSLVNNAAQMSGTSIRNSLERSSPSERGKIIKFQ
jgi:hypothetical protein